MITIFEISRFYALTKDEDTAKVPSKRITWTPDSTSGAQIAVDSSDTLHLVYKDGGTTQRYLVQKRHSIRAEIKRAEGDEYGVFK